MIFRNSMKSIFRSMGKTALFSLLIFALTLTFTLSVSVWMSVAQFLDKCDEFFTTIGLVEYMGSNYPGDTEHDSNMDEVLDSFDLSPIVDDDAILQWEQPARALGYVDGFWRSDKHMPSRMDSVLLIRRVSYHPEHHYYSALVIDVFYSLQVRPNTIIHIDEDFGPFEKNHYYLISGEVYDIKSPMLNLRQSNYENAIASSMGIEMPRLQDVTSDAPGERYNIPTGSLFLKFANTLEVINNSVLVSGTDDLMTLLPFHQEELFLVEGRTFTEEEYARGEKVIVVSQLLAARLGIQVGDTINLSIAVSDKPGLENSYWVDNGFSYQSPFTVVGIMNNVIDKSWYVFVPKAVNFPTAPFSIGYTVGYANLRNDEAAAFSARIEPMMSDRLQLTIYDQGYSNVATPYKTILGISKIVTVVCFLVELAVLILFGYLFVYRQRETSETMLLLGTGRVRVYGYFLFGAGFISLVSILAGAVTGYYLYDRIIALVTRAAENYTLVDSRFSNGNLSVSRTLEFAPELELQLFLYFGAAVFVLSTLACLVFVVSTFKSRKHRPRATKGPKKRGKTSDLKGGSLKYSILSILRGGARSFVVPALSLVVVMFFGQLATTSMQYQEQIDSISQNTTITGNLTDITGKQVGDLVLDGFEVSNLYRTGYLNELTVSISEPYKYLGIDILADGTDLNIPPLYVPSSGFAAESLAAEILRGPDITAINDIRTSPEFLYSETVILNFLDGYDETFLSVPSGDKQILSCLIPTSLMKSKDIHLGDTIRVAIDEVANPPEYNNASIFLHYDLRVIGTYEKHGAGDTIYVPLSLFFDTTLIWDPGQPAAGPPTETLHTGYAFTHTQKYLLQSITLNSAHFSLSDSHQLVSFKDYLADFGFSEVNHIGKLRTFMVLKDASFNHSIASLKQQIEYINIVFPILYVLVGMIGIVASYLLVVSRKVEFAIMRGLGTTRLHSFLSFFIEQSFLSMVGTLIGFSLWLFIWDLPKMLHITLTMGFLVCYLLGSAISVTIMNYSNVLDILSARE